MKRVPSLDGLRAVSIALVTLGHMASHGTAPRFLSQYASFGVQVFFVISGFIITKLLIQEKEATGAVDLKAFYWRRFYRIVPAAYCLIVPVLVLHWGVLHLSHFRMIDVLATLTFTSNYDLLRPMVVAGLWSLSVEEQFYILWPPVLAAFFAIRTKILCWALFTAPLFTLAFYALHWQAYIGTAFPTTYDTLAIGCLIAILGPRLDFTRSRWFGLCAPAALLLQWPWWHGHTLWPLTHACIGLFMIHAIHREYWVLNVAPVVWIGKISYGLYLWQFLVVIKFGLLWNLLCASASFYLVEQPILRWSKARKRAESSRPKDLSAA